MNPLTLCHVLSSVELGGAERVVRDLAKVQSAAGHRVFVVSLSKTDGPLSRELRPFVQQLVAVSKRARGVDPVLALRLARWFRAHRVQVVHTHNELPLVYGAPGGRLARAVVVHTKHGVVAVRPRAHRLRQAAALAVDRFVAVSQATADAAREGGECAPGKLRVVVNGTDLSRFPAPASDGQAVRRELGIPGSARVLVTVGRLVPEKNHALLLRAAAPLLGPDCHLVVAGDGVLRDALRTQAEALPGAPFVHLTGARLDVPAVLASADAYVLSSDSEGLPIALIEAWAAGLPAVSTAVGGIPAAAGDGESCLLVEKGDEAALTVALRRVLAGGDAVRAMAARGRDRALATYSAETMARAYQALYDECLGGPA
jgi:glycosyltransferase involved in cell wall biosynthesis